jgi:hypothetical protein
MDWAVLHGRWERVLSLAGQHSDPLTCFDVNTALARRGELGERMCAWPQRPDGLLLPMDAPYEFRVRVRLADQYLALGRVNSAERALWNTLPHTGDNPYLLRRLATCALVKGDRPAARLWLTVLGYDVIHGAWARDRLRRLASDPDSRGDAEVQSLRARLHRQDDLLRVSDVATGAEAISFYQNEMLRSTLDANPRNRLALDYLMALYLLIRRPDGVAQEIGRLAPGEPIPRLWEEGLLVAMDQPGARIDLRGHTISAAARQSYARFQALLAAQHGDARAAWPRLSRECAGSYFLYLAQARTGP